MFSERVKLAVKKQAFFRCGRGVDNWARRRRSNLGHVQWPSHRVSYWEDLVVSWPDANQRNQSKGDIKGRTVCVY